MKLTAAIAASYFGAEVKVNGYYNNDSTPKEIVGTMTHVGLMSIGTGGGQYSYSQCQLILTPLDKISDEDAVEVAKILDLNYSDTDENYYLDLVGMREYLSELFDGVNRFQDSYTFDKISKLIHYCQSHTIDIGHGYGDNHIPSLIAAGVAVEKTNL